LTIVFGASFGTSVTLTKYGTGDDPAAYTTFTSLSLAPGEVILVIESDVTIANIQTIKGYGVPTDTKFFVSTESTLIGSNDRLGQSQAKLKQASSEWSLTPDIASMTSVTYSSLKSGFDHLANSTSDGAWWNNGSTEFRKPGVWP